PRRWLFGIATRSAGGGTGDTGSAVFPDRHPDGVGYNEGESRRTRAVACGGGGVEPSEPGVCPGDFAGQKESVVIVTVSSRHMEVTPAMKTYAEQKANKLLKYFDRIQE